jgi:hypothetical protein
MLPRDIAHVTHMDSLSVKQTEKRDTLSDQNAERQPFSDTTTDSGGVLISTCVWFRVCVCAFDVCVCHQRPLRRLALADGVTTLRHRADWPFLTAATTHTRTHTHTHTHTLSLSLSLSLSRT